MGGACAPQSCHAFVRTISIGWHGLEGEGFREGERGITSRCSHCCKSRTKRTFVSAPSPALANQYNTAGVHVTIMVEHVQGLEVESDRVEPLVSASWEDVCPETVMGRELLNG